MAFIAKYDYNHAFDNEELMLSEAARELEEKTCLPVNLEMYQIASEYEISGLRADFYRRNGPINYTILAGHGNQGGVAFEPEFRIDTTGAYAPNELNELILPENDRMLTADDLSNMGDFAEYSSKSHNLIFHSCSVARGAEDWLEKYLAGNRELLVQIPYSWNTEIEGPNEIYFGSKITVDEDGELDLQPLWSDSAAKILNGNDVEPGRCYFMGDTTDDGRDLIVIFGTDDNSRITPLEIFNRTDNRIYTAEDLESLSEDDSLASYASPEEWDVLDYYLRIKGKPQDSFELYDKMPQGYESISSVGKPTPLERTAAWWIQQYLSLQKELEELYSKLPLP